MSAYFAVEYTIRFDDTMAYGSHHFLTSFKFQCAAREGYLFGERIFDLPGVKDSLDEVQLLTADAYARNLRPTTLGDRVAILMTLEDWGQASARFCYRVINERGEAICAGFQTLISADAKTGDPMPIPQPLRDAMETMRDIEEVASQESFRDRVLAGGRKLESLFGRAELEAARKFLSERYPRPGIVSPANSTPRVTPSIVSSNDLQALHNQTHGDDADVEAWVFAGQGAFNPELLRSRVEAYQRLGRSAEQELRQCVAIAGERLGGNAGALIGSAVDDCKAAIRQTPELSQVAIHLQNVLGALLRIAGGRDPHVLLGHSFGEIAAVGLAGGFDLPTGIEVVCSRSQAITSTAPSGGGLLAIGTDRFFVEAEAKFLRLDQVVIAGRNHDCQTVASGPIHRLTKLQDRIQRTGIATVAVPSPTSFHHPSLLSTASVWRERLREFRLGSISRNVYSPIGRRFLTPHDDVALVLSSQLLRPFDLQGALLDLVESGVTRFVDCGTTGSLAALISKVVPETINVSCAAKERMARSGAANFQQRTSHAANIPQRIRLSGSHSSSVGGLAREVMKSQLAASGSAPNNTSESVALAPSPIPRSGKNLASQQNKQHLINEDEPEASLSLLPKLSIVGAGCILPGGASSPDRLFAAITEQRLGLVDQRTLDPHWTDDFYSAKLIPDRSTSHLAGRVDDADIVAPQGIDPDDFKRFTRTQQLLCISLAGCLGSLQGAKRIACIVGATADGFEDLDEVTSLVYCGIDPTDSFVDQQIHSARSAGQTPHSAVQEVIDQMLGPGVKVTLIDAACASSLYAIALGMQLLERDVADAVIAGGLFCPGPGNSCLFSQFGGTTSTGCRPFDANADGVVFSEGAALVTLRRQSDAKRLGLPILANVRGAGLSSDGKSSSANVPQTHGQLLALERCYRKYGIDPSSIQAIEAHGTSTPVGDSTELETLRRFFSSHLSEPIPVHSLKGLLGHAGWAAGAASVIAVCEYFHQRIFPAQAFYQEPSQAVRNSDGVLSVPLLPIALASGPLRIAIDGFGFGGANAHMVLESAEGVASQDDYYQHLKVPTGTDDDSIVIVAFHEIAPQESSVGGARFDRGQVKLPKKFLVLPDLAEDMDVSQILTVTLTDEIVQQLCTDDAELRRETGVILALRGKTERGVEATTRVLGQRLLRQLGEDARYKAALESACQRARPSRAYTLQCMMPNVASGRAALMLDLNAPNFVVDSGCDSFSAAMLAASSLLQSGVDGGTQLVVVAAVSADSGSDPTAGLDQDHDEYAIAIGMTTRRIAKQRGWTEILDAKSAMNRVTENLDQDRLPTEPDTEMKDYVRLFRHSSDVSSREHSAETLPELPALDCPIHHPVWVEKPLESKPGFDGNPLSESCLIIIPDNPELLEWLLVEWPPFTRNYLVAVVGKSAADLVSKIKNPRVIAVENVSTDAAQRAIEQVKDFQPDLVATLQTPRSWDVIDTLAEASEDNSLCEFLFLVSQCQVKRMQQGVVQYYHLMTNAWNEIVHPRSGAIAGFLKSLQREFPNVRASTLCTRSDDWGSLLKAFETELAVKDFEQEVVYDGDRRLVRRLQLSSQDSHARPAVSLNRSSVVVASGGAKGVTAVMLESILRDFGCTVVALGRSPLEPGPKDFDSEVAEQAFYRKWMLDNPHTPPMVMKKAFEQARARWEAHQTIESLRSIGGRVEYHIVDITDSDQVRKAIDQIASDHGRIDLLIHGAGVQFSKRLQHRSLDEFRQTFSVKVTGLRNLVESCHSRLGRMVDTHVLTSAYSIFGNDGQHDYGAANETLDRLCELNNIGRTQNWSSIAWLAWDGIGMTRGSEYSALAKQRRLTGVNRESGQRIFRDVLAGRTRGAINVPLSEAEHVEYQIRTVPKAIDSKSPAGRILELPVDLTNCDCLNLHRVRGFPTLPGAWTLERFVHAASQLRDADGSEQWVTIENVSFQKFVRLNNDHDPYARVVVGQRAGRMDAWMLVDVLHRNGQVLARDVVCAHAKLSFGSNPESLSPTLTVLREDVGDLLIQSAPDPYCCANHRDIGLSGHFNCLRGIRIGERGRCAKLVCDASCPWAGDIPALALDSAWRLGAMYTDVEDLQLFVPVKIGRIIVPFRRGDRYSTHTDWTVVSSRPQLIGDDARWDRTEVYCAKGMLCMIVEDAVAKSL